MKYQNYHPKPTQANVLAQALVRVQQNLNLTQKDLSEIIHASEATISRLKNQNNSIDPNSAEGQFALYFVRVYRSLSALVGGDDKQSQAWISNYNSHLNGVPIDLIKNNLQDFQKVLAYLDAMRGLA